MRMEYLHAATHTTVICVVSQPANKHVSMYSVCVPWNVRHDL